MCNYDRYIIRYSGISLLSLLQVQLDDQIKQIQLINESMNSLTDACSEKELQLSSLRSNTLFLNNELSFKENEFRNINNIQVYCAIFRYLNVTVG